MSKKQKATKSAAKPTVQTAPKAKVPVVKVEAARHAAPTAKIGWTVKANPKRPNSAAHARAEMYWGTPTVGDYLSKGGLREDLAWDADHGFLTIA